MTGAEPDPPAFSNMVRRLATVPRTARPARIRGTVRAVWANGGMWWASGVQRLGGLNRRHPAAVRIFAASVAVLTPALAVALVLGATWTPLDRPHTARWAVAPTPGATPSPPPTPSSPPPPYEVARPNGSRLVPSPVPVVDPLPVGEFVGWAVLDRATGAIIGSDNLAETSTTASMIKAWIAADYLRRTDESGRTPPPQRLDELTKIIRDSDNALTQDLFEELGSHASIERLIDICGLTDSYAVPWLWSNTNLSPRDTARMGACLADGRAAGPRWTGWLLDEMRAVRGIGDFGIRKAFPPRVARGIAIKNGWVIRSASGEYHVNCLAIGDGWTMGVLTRYPAELGYQHGAGICESLAAANLR